MIMMMAVALIPGMDIGEADFASAATSTGTTTFYASQLAGSETGIDITGDLELIMDADLSIVYIKADGDITITSQDSTKHILTLEDDDAQIKADSDENGAGDLVIDGIELSVYNLNRSSVYGKSVTIKNATVSIKNLGINSLVYGQSVSIANSDITLISYSDTDTPAIVGWKENVIIEDSKLTIENPVGYADKRPSIGISTDGGAVLRNVTGIINSNLDSIHAGEVLLEGCDLTLISKNKCCILSDFDVLINNSTLILSSKTSAIHSAYENITIEGSDLKVSTSLTHSISTGDEGTGNINITDSYVKVTGNSASFPLITRNGTINLSDGLYVKDPEGGKIGRYTDSNGDTVFTVLTADGKYVPDDCIIARTGKDDPVFADEEASTEPSDQNEEETEPSGQNEEQSESSGQNEETTEPSGQNDEPAEPSGQNENTDTDTNSGNNDINDNTSTFDDSTGKQENIVPTEEKTDIPVTDSVEKIKISKANIKLGYEKTSYNGKKKKPSVTVKYNGIKLKKGKDYTVKYSNNIKVGKATVKVVGKGKFKGTKKLSFKINPKATKITKLLKAKKGFTVKWNKVTKQNQGYKIQYSLKKNMKGAKTVTVSSAKKASKKITKLKAKKTYYVRIRTYKKVKGVTYSSKWSAVKKVKTK